MVIRLLTVVVLLFVACDGRSENEADEPQGILVRDSRESVIWGALDNRTDTFLLDGVAQRLAQASDVALICVDRLQISGNDVSIANFLPGGGVPTLQGRVGVCSSEPFAQQLSAASCSGTLIDDDIVLTAGHCAAMVSPESGCTGIRVLTNFRMDGATALHPLTVDDVYQISSSIVGPTDGLVLQGGQYRTFDHWVLRLDRKVKRPNAPAGVRTNTALLSNASSLTVMGHPSGLPTKIDLAAVSDNEGFIQGYSTTFPCSSTDCDIFTATADAYKGNSGGGVFEQPAHQLVGVLVRGGWTGAFFELGSDFTSGPGCKMSLLCDASSCLVPNCQYASMPIGLLCAQVPGARPCGAIAGMHGFSVDAVVAGLPYSFL